VGGYTGGYLCECACACMPFDQLQHDALINCNMHIVEKLVQVMAIMQGLSNDVKQCVLHVRTFVSTCH